MENVPADLLWAWSIVGVLVGDIMKKIGLVDWIMPVNAAIGGVLACLMMTWGFNTFLLGMSVGLGATGLHRAAKLVNDKRT